MRVKHLVLSVLALISFISCDEYKAPSSKVFQVDNPLTREIAIEIDGNALVIPATTAVPIALEFGKHTLTYNKESICFYAKKCEQEVVLNPTLSNYIFYHEFYTDPNNANKVAAEIEQIEQAYLYDFDLGDGEIYEVPFKVLNSLFIEQDANFWHYGVDTSYPTSETIHQGSTSLSVVVKSKLFRESDFLDYAADMFVEGFRFPAPEIQNLSLIEPDIKVEESFFDFDCEEAAHTAKQM